MIHPIQNPDSPPGQLAQALRELANAAGFESLRELAKSAHCSPTTTHAALSGKTNQVPTTEVIKAICSACKADEPTLARLLDMRKKAITERDTSPSSTDGQPPSVTPGPTAPVDQVPTHARGADAVAG